MIKKTFVLSRKKAFSLIELSIVLIIIGLLVAGVTGGASLIRNAELRGVMNEARGYATAVNSFYTKFNALPGDYNVATIGMPTGTATGNFNGNIEFINAVTGPAAKLESNIAWQQLINGGFIENNFTPGSADATTTTTYTPVLTPGASSSGIPASRIKNGGWIFDYITAATQNVVILTGAVTTSTFTISSVTAAAPTVIIVPADALSIDTKMDDAIANAGKVRASTVTSSCNSTTTYSTTSTSQVCALTFQVDPNS